MTSFVILPMLRGDAEKRFVTRGILLSSHPSSFVEAPSLATIMGCCKCCTPKVQAIVGLSSAPLNFAILIWAIAEKVRWTPFYVPLECDTPTPDGVRLSLLSMPSPYAESMGLTPGSPPHGIYANMTVSTSCFNPGQAKTTILAAGFEAVELAPNLTDLENGGFGVPYTVSARAHLAGDAVYPIGGRGEMVTVAQTAMTMENILASMTPDAIARGYSLSYARVTQTVQTCAAIFGLVSCTDVPSEQFCGSYAGNCVVPVLDSSGDPVVPEQLEPALCAYTGKLCGEEAEVHAQLSPEAMGIQVVNRTACDAALGLPNGTLCNAIEAPGVDPATLRPRAVEPAITLTTEALARMNEGLAVAESAINMMIWLCIGFQGLLFVINLASGLFNLRKHLRAKAAQAEARGAPPTLATNALDGKA
ncbi:unnamed protein product [Symbiodinium sp. CCMP2592]|nr:unnamed protein product [Symbiodinium sp. CCMP2592]